MRDTSKILTFEEFQASGKDVRFADVHPDRLDCYGNEFGRLYANGSCYIEKVDKRKGKDLPGWYLIIERSEWLSNDLSELESILYNNWYLTEIAPLH